jgi:branched-chain amino acid aminotransferase
MHPASTVLHYGQAIFEGLKGYRQPDGSIAAFRPDRNAKRFAASADRLAMPPLPEDMFLASLRALAEADRAWVPDSYGASLYFRPMMFSTDVGLMTGPSKTYRFVLFACPVADYFPNGVKPVTVWVSSDYVRAVRGGTGEAKCAGNYAASFLVQQKAVEVGCDQVVWLDAMDRSTIEEMGGMNIFFVSTEDGAPKLVTPRVSGSLLKGVTRESLLRLAGDLGYQVEERQTTFRDWQAGCADGTITESFACGTAAVITPIGRVKSDNVDFQIGGGGTGEVTGHLRKALLDIQHGMAADEHQWRYALTGEATAATAMT